MQGEAATADFAKNLVKGVEGRLFAIRDAERPDAIN